MNQILHIFKKDTRRFWLEVLISSAILFAYVWLYPGKWKVYHDQSQWIRIQQYVGTLGLLVPVGWWVLVARLVHAETLVGDEQFWITRPYQWPKLLAAKVLFLAVWLGVPYLLAQSLLMTVAGFHPLPYLPAMLHGFLVATVVFVLPLMALAAVTSTFARVTLTLVGGFVLFIAYNFWASVPRLYVASEPYGNRVAPVLLIVGCIAAIVLQYATRRVWLTRGILLAMPVLMAISAALYGRASLVDRAYPQLAAGASAPVNITSAISSAADAERPATARIWDGQVHLYLPVQYTGLADDKAVFEDDVKFTITSADGSQWSSSWQRESEHIVPDVHGGSLELRMMPDVYDRFKSAPVTLEVAFAMSRYQADSVTQMPYPAGDVAVPGIGFCTPQSYGLPNLHCRSAIEVPHLTYIRVMWSKSGCSDPAHLFDPAAIGDAWTGPLGSDTRLALVTSSNFWMGYQPNEEERKQHLQWDICPGSPMTVTTYHSLGSVQTRMTLTNFTLPADIPME